MRRIALLGACCCAFSTAGAAAGAGSFNPDISLILQGRYVQADEGVGAHLDGFLTAAGDEEHDHAHETLRGFSLDHSELTFSASIDPYFYGFANLAVAEDGLELEEVWFQTLALGNGLTVKGGRFLSQVGYANEQHSHAWDFADQNLVYRALFGEHLVQDGVQARWLAPTETFMELGVEAARGQFFPGSEEGGDRNGAGTRAAFFRVGSDLGVSQSWRAGVSHVASSPRERASHLEDLADVEAEALFSGDSRTWLVDAVWKWAPGGNARDRNLKLQAEYFRRREKGELVCEDNAGEGGVCEGSGDAYRSTQSGFYAQAVYQFMPRWRIGYRYERLDSGSVDFGANADALPAPDHDPSRHTAMLDYSPSEFSRLRLQLARDRTGHDEAETVAVLQYIMSIGPHGAHKF